MDVLEIAALLEARIMLLEGVAMDGIDQVEREIGIEIKERAAEEAIDFEGVAIGASFAVVSGEGAEGDSAAVGGIDIAEARQSAGIHEIERDLAGGVKIVASEEEAE